MPKLDEIRKLLEQWTIRESQQDDWDQDDDDYDDSFGRIIGAIGKLPKNLKVTGYAVLGLNEKGKRLNDDFDDDDDRYIKLEAAQNQLKKIHAQFDKLPATDRKKIFSAIAPKIADWLEAGWQHLKATPYAIGYSSKAFRAPKNPEASLGGRIEWVETLARCAGNYKEEALTLSWLAAWAQHAFEYRADCVIPILIAAMNTKGKEGDEVFDILYKTVTREHSIGIMGEHVIGSLLGSNREAGWDIMEKTLIAAQRQEGLRQSILQNADAAHPQAFQRLLRVILDKDLIRFSSVSRAVNGWLGLLWDSVSAKVLTENVEAILKLLDSETERKKALASNEAETVYRALWASAYFDAPATVALTSKLLKSTKDEIRFVAVWLLTQLGLESAANAKAGLVEDPNLQVAMLAATGLDGLSIDSDMEEDFDPSIDSDDEEGVDKDAFEKIERLYARLPEKPLKLKAMVWPWTERKVERSMVTSLLLSALGKRPPTKLLPYMKALDSWEQRQVITLLAAQKKWDSLTRETLFELVGHASSDVREAALGTLEKQSLKPDEFGIFEGYLTRQAADLRKGVIGMILKDKDATALASADRLLAKGDRNQRLGGLEIVRQLAVANRSRKACQDRGVAFRESQKKLSKEEEAQLKSIAESDREVISLDNAFGFMNPAGRSKVVPPQKKKVPLITKASLACLKSLDDFVHAHRTESARIKTYSGYQDMLLGEMESYNFPGIDLSKPIAAQRKKFPFVELFGEWNAKRPASFKDKDGLELLRAMFAAELFDDYDFDQVKDFAKKPETKKIAVAVLGEINAPKFRYLSQVCGILDWLFFSEIPKGCTDYLLDCTENTLAHVTDEMQKALVSNEPKAKKRHYWDEDEDDWREEKVFQAWPELLDQFFNRTSIKLTAEQVRRKWQLDRFIDEPCPGAKRRRLELEQVANAYKAKLATFDDVVDCLLGPNRQGYREFDELGSLTARSHSKETQALLNETKGLKELVDKVREFLLANELERGESATPGTGAVLELRCISGISNLFRIMAALNNSKFKVDRGWRGNTGDSRSATLTQLLKITYPTENETAADFIRFAKKAIADGYCSEERLLELAFLAPQWSKFIGETIGWNGFSEGLYWFLSHMNTWYNDAKDAAASAEGLEGDIDDDDDDDFDEDEDDDEGEDGEPKSDSISKPKKLSGWERLVLERTPLTLEERQEGAVDVAWFHQTWKTLGEKRWKQMAESAKFAANTAQANKAQFLADVLLGNKPRKELIDGIQKRFLKEYVRLLGLLPLAQDSKRDKDLMERYEVLQGYKKYARGLSSLTKPSALRAAEIGMSNLARIAGYPDPLRLEWALEAESIKDLAKGPISVTKEGVTVTLGLDQDAKPQISIMRGDKSIKSIPAPIKKKHAAIAELAERATELRKKSSRIKMSLETAMCRGDAISASELVSLFDHAILAPQLSKIVLIGDGIAGYPDKGGKVLRDYNGKLEPIKKNESLRIAHSTDLFARGDWDKWQHECFHAERVQPFKQVFRELYVVTKQEKKDQIRSQRFAGQQVGPRQAMALWNSRGWHTQDEVVKIFHDLSLIAEVTFQYDYGTAAEIEGLTVEDVRFRKRDEFKPMKLADVPPSVFSEVMRDVDLVVSVAHRGEVDPEASASTVEMRSALIRETCQLLGLKNVTLKGTHAIIKGYYGDYSLHLGSAGIHRLPGGSLAILPVHAQHRGRIFLPFADDDPRTAEIVSKVLLLARDEEIQDPMILDQLGAALSKRPVLVVAPPTPSKSSGTKSKSKPSSDPASTGTVGSAAGGKRRFEFQEGSSNKFWEVELNGNSVKTTWGRIGTDGQSKSKDFADASKAQAEYDKLIKEKTSKGYKEA